MKSLICTSQFEHIVIHVPIKERPQVEDTTWKKNKSLHKEQVSKEFIITLNMQQVIKVKDQHTFE